MTQVVHALFAVNNASGQQVVHSRILSKQFGLAEIDGVFRLHLSIPPLWLTPGLYSVYFKLISLHSAPVVRTESERLMLEVKDDFDAGNRGIIHPKIDWKIEPLEAPFATANGTRVEARANR